MISKHSAHLTPLPFGICTWLWQYTYLLLLISMLWHRQAIFESKGDTYTHTYIHTYLLLLISMLWHMQAIYESKGDKLSSSAEGRIRTRGPRHQFASRLNARWQTDWAIEDQAETWTRQPVPMISQHSAHLAPLSVDFRTWLWRYTFLLLLISMLWPRQAIFKSKGDKLCSSAESRIWTRGPDTNSPADWMLVYWSMHDLFMYISWMNDFWFLISLTNRLSYRGSSRNLNSTARPYDQQAFSPPDPTAIWHLHLALAIYIFVVVNFDALAQASEFRIERRYIHTYIHSYIFVVVNFDALAHASDIRIERRQVVFLCWRQDSNPEGLRHLFASRLNACWQTDWAIEDQAKNLNSTGRPYDQQAFSTPDPTAIWHLHLALAIYIFVVVNFDALAQTSDFPIGRRYIHTYIHTYIHICCC